MSVGENIIGNRNKTRYINVRKNLFQDTLSEIDRKERQKIKQYQMILQTEIML